LIVRLHRSQSLTLKEVDLKGSDNRSVELKHLCDEVSEIRSFFMWLFSDLSDLYCSLWDYIVEAST